MSLSTNPRKVDIKKKSNDNPITLTKVMNNIFFGEHTRFVVFNIYIYNSN